MPDVSALVEATSKGLNHDPEIRMAVPGGLEP